MERKEAILNALIVWDESCSGKPDAFERALAEHGFAVVPLEPSEEMLAAAVPDPVHLYE